MVSRLLPSSATVSSPPGLACLARTSGAGAEQRSHLLSHLHDSFLPPTSPVSSPTTRRPTRSIWHQLRRQQPGQTPSLQRFLEYHRGHKVPLLQQSWSLHSLAGPPSLLDDLTPNPNEPRQRKTPPERSPPSSSRRPSHTVPFPNSAGPSSPRLAAPDQVQPYTHGKSTAYLDTRTRSWQYESQSLYHHYRESETLFGL